MDGPTPPPDQPSSATDSAEPPARVGGALAAGCQAIAALGLGAVLSFRMLAEFDLPWHLSFGREIARSHAVPRTDALSFTHTPIRAIGVLADLLLYAVVHAFGPLGLQLLNGLVGVALAASLLFRARDSRPAAWFVVAGATVALSPWLFTRPSTLGFVFTSLVLLLIGEHRRSPSSTRGRRALWAAAGLHVVWCNMHGSALLGVALLTIYAVHRALTTRFGGQLASVLQVADRGHVVESALAAFAAAGACCLNPSGAAFFLGPLELRPYESILGEWQKTSWDFFVHQSPAAGVMLAVSALVLVLGKSAAGRRYALFDLAIVLLALYLATRVRFVPVAIILVAPEVAARLSPYVHPTRLIRAAAAVAPLIVVPAVSILDQTTWGVGWEPRHFPERAVVYLAREKPAGPMWNFWPFGGYLMWRLPEHEVFLDGRIGFVHDHDTVFRAVASETDAASFAALDARFHFEWAVCRVAEGLDSCLPIQRSRAWRMVFLDRLSAIYVKRGGPNAALGETGYRAITHATRPEAVMNAAIQCERPGDLAYDGTRAREQDPESPAAWFLDACGALATRDWPRFDLAVQGLTTLAPDHPAVNVLRSARAAVEAPPPPASSR